MFARNSQQDSRRRDFKKGIVADDARRKREDQRLSLRKSKRDEQLQKRRHTGASSDGFDCTSTRENNVLSHGSASVELPLSLETLPGYVQRLNSNDPDEQTTATMALRKMLSVEKNPPISQVVASGVVPRLVQFLSDYSRPKIQFEAAWALTNIASGTSEQTHCLIEHGAVGPFIANILSHDAELREQCVWALGNIAGDSPQFRDYCLSQGMLAPLLQTLTHPSSSISMRRNACWALSNLCRGKPQPDFASVKDAVPVLAQLIQSSDKELIIDALWALSYVSDGSNDRIAALIDSGVAPTLVQLLSHVDFTVQTPALRTVGNIVTGDDSQTEAMLNAGALYPLAALLRTERKAIRKEAAWAVSNITAGNTHQTQRVLDTPGMITELVRLLEESDHEVRKECAWVISNATTWKNSSQIYFMVRAGVVPPLCEMLKSADVRMIDIIFEAMVNILTIGQEGVNTGKTHQNEFYEIFEEAEAFDRLEELQEHQAEAVYEKAVEILETYFSANDEQENVNTNAWTPQVSGSQFTFAPPPAAGQNNFGAFAF